MSEQVQEKSKFPNKKPKKLILIVSGLVVVALGIGTSLWTSNVYSSAKAICISGETSRANLLSGIVGAMKYSDNSGLLSLTSLRALDYEKSETLKYSDYSKQVLTNLDSIDAELAGNPLTSILNPDLSAKVSALRNAYQKLNGTIEDIESNPNTAKLSQAEIDQVNNSLSFDIFTMKVNPIKQLRFELAVAAYEKYSQLVFTDSVIASIKSSYGEIASAGGNLNNTCKK